MSTVSFLQIFFVCLLGAMSPGPSMVVVVNNAIFKNRYHGILTSLGHGIGIGIYALFAVLGIGIVIETNLFLFNGIKILSVIFLIYLGIKSIINNTKLDFEKKSNTKEGVTSFLQGFSISILNPKILIWFVAIYSQFMSLDNDIIFNSYLILTAGIVDATWYIFLTLSVTSNLALEFVKNKIATLQRFLGITFIALGLILLTQILI
jgi:threonine/homoserine/homoserine lactone efflux protein